ncbi:hypothetical protein [Streptomyces sp. NPDC090036]|uniref:hypothetical protein n=1 Tax=Streptomyces sp. NPDC090036 TaxID=3365926 RepID=UPI00380C07D1
MRIRATGGPETEAEPDWASLALASEDPEAAHIIADAVGGHVPHRRMGRQLRGLLVAAGFADVRLEVELVVCTSVTELSHVISLERAAHAAWTGSLIPQERAQALLREQHLLSESGGLHATFQRTTVAWARRPPATGQ